MIYNWFYTSQIVSRISSINSMLHASFKAILGGDVPFKGDVTVHPYSNKGVFSAVELSDVGQRLTNTAQHPHFSCGQQNRMALQHLCLSIDRQSSMLCIGIIYMRTNLPLLGKNQHLQTCSSPKCFLHSQYFKRSNRYTPVGVVHQKIPMKSINTRKHIPCWVHPWKKKTCLTSKLLFWCSRDFHPKKCFKSHH